MTATTTPLPVIGAKFVVKSATGKELVRIVTGTKRIGKMWYATVTEGDAKLLLPVAALGDRA
jgi:hypothetical protein